MKTILITGVCGVGKSTITSELAQKLDCSWGDYADVMLEIMGETDKDKIQYLNRNHKQNVINDTEKLIEKRFAEQEDDHSLHLFENHLSIIQNEDIITFPLEDYQRYNSIGLVVIEALASSILLRRQADNSRKRILDTRELIEEQQRINALEADKISSLLHIPWIRVVNSDNIPPLNQLETWYLSLERQNKS
jgi:adenylate kinase